LTHTKKKKKKNDGMRAIELETENVKSL